MTMFVMVYQLVTLVLVAAATVTALWSPRRAQRADAVRVLRLLVGCVALSAGLAAAIGAPLDPQQLPRDQTVVSSGGSPAWNSVGGGVVRAEF
jgi:hypothetical protein